MYISLNLLRSKIKKKYWSIKINCSVKARNVVRLFRRQYRYFRIRVCRESNCLASNRRGVTRNEKFVIYWLYYKFLFLAVNCLHRPDAIILILSYKRTVNIQICIIYYAPLIHNIHKTRCNNYN